MLAQVFEGEIDNRRSVKSEDLRKQQATDHGDTQRLAQFGTGAESERQRNSAKHCRHRRHHDWAEADDAGFVDRVLGRQTLFAFGIEREIDHHDRVFFTMPINRMIAMKLTSERSIPNTM